MIHEKDMKFIINGQKPLNGEISVSGAKNHALKVFPACILINGDINISNVPEIEDIHRIIEIMQDLGADIKKIADNQYKVNTGSISKTDLNPELIPKLRASIMLAGPMLVKYGQVKMPHPGGCVIGKRPIDIFLSGYKKFGAEIIENDDHYLITGKNLKGTEIFLPMISVTNTETFMTMATLIPGKTIIKNAAMEPEIPALAEFLNLCGAKITGAGTPTIEIEGVNELNATDTAIIPDRIEAGTFAIMGVLAKSKIKITNCEPKHLESLWAMFDKIEARYKLGKNYIETMPAIELKATNLKTHEYPGFPTDLQSPFTVLLTQTRGMSMVHETIFEGRLFYTDKLSKMGADIIMCDPYRVVINGPTPLYGTKVESPDLRAGMALILAAMVAQGTTEIDNIYQIDRGYQKIDERLRNIGVDIQRINDA